MTRSARIDEDAARALLSDLKSLQALLTSSDAVEPPLLSDVIAGELSAAPDVIGGTSIAGRIENGTAPHDDALQPQRDTADVLLREMTQRLDTSLAVLRAEMLQQLRTEIERMLVGCDKPTG